MLSRSASRGAGIVLVLAIVVVSCGPELQPEAPRQTAAADTVPARSVQYSREYSFVGESESTPIVVPFIFSATEADGRIQRRARGWLVHGSEWDAFLQESWSAPAAAGVWRIEPAGGLRVIAGGPTNDIEALLFRRGDRMLRLSPEILRATYTPTSALQYRLYEGRLEVGGRITSGAVLEAYRVQLGVVEEDFSAGAHDWLFVTDGGSVHLLLAETLEPSGDASKTFGWMVRPDTERSWDRAEIRWLEMRPVEPARRDAPVAWSFRIPESGVEGEVYSLGSQVQLGPDRPGRRAVVIRHSIEGWVGIGEDRYRIFGLLRHSQE